MAGVSNKHHRDQALEFQDFLTNLQEWEYSLKEKDKKLKGQSNDEKKMASSSRKIGIVGEEKGLSRKAPKAVVNEPSDAVRLKVPLGGKHVQQYGNLRNSDAISRISSSLLTEESFPDAASEKELGNELFKQKKYMEAIQCYSRSIALSPTSVAFANRAMAYLKIKRFEEAENDCTEALSLDDRYVKAYSRRATARKELGKLKASIEDLEFALRLEPNNQELKKQHAGAKALYGKELVEKISGPVKNSIQGIQSVGDSKVEGKGNVPDAHFISGDSQMAAAVKADHIEDKNGKSFSKPAIVMKEIESKTARAENRCGEQQLERLREGATLNSSAGSFKLDSKQTNNGFNKRELKASVQEIASRAASRVLADASKIETPTPTSAYQFEVSWRRLSDDRTLQGRLLKTIPPPTLPQLFKNALSAPILMEIIKCVADFFTDETELAINILENLAKVARFDMIIMCLSAVDRIGKLGLNLRPQGCDVVHRPLSYRPNPNPRTLFSSADLPFKV